MVRGLSGMEHQAVDTARAVTCRSKQNTAADRGLVAAYWVCSPGTAAVTQRQHGQNTAVCSAVRTPHGLAHTMTPHALPPAQQGYSPCKV